MTAPHEPTDATLDAMHACTIGGAPSRDQWRAVYRVAVEAYDAELRRVLGARDDESTADAARRVVAERDEALSATSHASSTSPRSGGSDE